MARQLSPSDVETHRLQNRECMRKARQRRRRDVQEMKVIVLHLETEYAELYQRSSSKTQDVHISKAGQEQEYADALVVAKRLGAENLLLQTMIKKKTEWGRRLQRVLDFEASSVAYTPQLDSSSNDLQLDVLDEDEAAKELGFRPLTELELERSIADNTRKSHSVESRLLLQATDLSSRRTRAFGWEIVQQVNGSVMEFVFTKKFTGLNTLDVIHKAWANNLELLKVRRIKAETRRLQILQRLQPNAFVFVLDEASPGEISTFRSVFVRFLTEVNRDLVLNGLDNEPQTGTGYVLGTQSVRTDRIQRFSKEELAGKLAWAYLSLTIGVFDVVNSSIGEKHQCVRWVGRTDYCTEEHAQRNASDTLQILLRWEMLVIAPALQLSSLSPT